MKKILTLALLVISFLSFNSSKNSISIIGKWTGVDKGKVGYITFDKDGYATFEIEGQIIGGKEFIMDGKKGKMTYDISLDEKPIEIDFTITKFETNEQKKILCIAQFEDENNMNFQMSFDSERPTKFDKETSIKLKRIE